MDDTSLPYVLTFASVGYLTLSWDGDHSETLGVLLHAVKILSLRIRVERFTIASAAYDEWGVKGAESYGWATPVNYQHGWTLPGSRPRRVCS